MYHQGRLSSGGFRAPALAAARGQELQSLVDADDLRGRFFSWRGGSGKRYVCSVFQTGEASFVADVTEGLIIGVARDGAAARPVCVIRASAGVAGERRAFRETGAELGVTEWHVLFNVDAETARDLSLSLLN